MQQLGYNGSIWWLQTIYKLLSKHELEKETYLMSVIKRYLLITDAREPMDPRGCVRTAETEIDMMKMRLNGEKLVYLTSHSLTPDNKH